MRRKAMKRDFQRMATSLQGIEGEHQVCQTKNTSSISSTDDLISIPHQSKSPLWVNL